MLDPIALSTYMQNCMSRFISPFSRLSLIATLRAQSPGLRMTARCTTFLLHESKHSPDCPKALNQNANSGSRCNITGIKHCGTWLTWALPDQSRLDALSIHGALNDVQHCVSDSHIVGISTELESRAIYSALYSCVFHC